MAGKLLGMAKKAFMLVLIELLVPGGTLVVLALFLTGSSAPAALEKVAPLRPLLKALRRTGGNADAG